MKVVLAHKFLRLSGGTERYFRDLGTVLAAHGHETIPFAIDEADGPESRYRKYFPPAIDYRDTRRGYRLRNSGRILSRTLYSRDARRRMAELVRHEKPDLAHIQSIEHHISPSILYALAEARVPMVQSVNTYKHVCASYRLYLLDRQQICTRCLYGKYYHAALTRCVKGSLAASLLASAEMYLHQKILRVYHKIQRFIVPNQFMKEQMLGAGFPPRKLVRLRNPLDLGAYQPTWEMRGFILYFGRVDPEKGVMVLVEAMRRLPGLRLVVVGDGLEQEACVHRARELGCDQVEFVGPKWGDELMPYLLGCDLVVVPSLWFEPSPYVIYQAFAAGKPVLASATGGIPDLITEETGELAEAGNVDDWAGRLEALATDRAKLAKMGRAARRWAEANLAIETYYDKLMRVYAEARDECRR